MQKHVFLVVALASMVVTVSSLDYVARYQPELDWVTIDPYIENPRLFNLQVRCLLDDGPCDIVGRWVKPRVASALLGTCIKCTPHQHSEVNRFLQWVQDNRPELFKKAVKKFLENEGISIPTDKTITVAPQSSSKSLTSNENSDNSPDTQEDVDLDSPTTTVAPGA